jgi:hypothetical protein
MVDAIEILEDGLACCREIDGFEYEAIVPLDVISRCYYELKDEYLADLKLRQAIEAAEIVEWTYGKSHRWSLALKARLEAWLREWGRDAEAAVLKREVDEILGPDDLELEYINAH